MSASVYKRLAELVGARRNCIESGNDEWKERHEDAIESIMSTAPSGSGFDSGTKIMLDASTSETLKFSTEFHHLNGMGYYGGWTPHIITVRGSLQFGYTVTVGGQDKNGIKEYIHDVFHSWLGEIVAH